MADAEIIPIGTRGRPGRGVGRDKPSSAARSLAPKVPKSAKSAASRSRTATTRRTRPVPAAPEQIEQVTTEAVPPPAPAAPPETSPRPGTTTRDRGPLAGISPVSSNSKPRMRSAGSL